MVARSGKASREGRRDSTLAYDQHMLGNVTIMVKHGLMVESNVMFGRYQDWMKDVTERRGPDFLKDVVTSL